MREWRNWQTRET